MRERRWHRPPGAGEPGTRSPAPLAARWSRAARAEVFGDLRAALAYLLTACLAGGSLLGATTAPAPAAGAPGEARPGCPFPLDNRTGTTCVTREVYERAGADVQRAAALGLAWVLVVQAGVALGTFDRFRTTPRRA